MTEPFEESAKAAQEVAKTTGKAIDAAREAGSFLDRIFGNGVEDWVGLHWSDRIRAKRIAAAIYDWERLQLLLKKAKDRLGNKQFREAPPKILIGILESATLEEEQSLQELWANLLASSLDYDQDPIERQYVSVLADLSVDDARALQEFHAAAQQPQPQKKARRGELTYGPGVDTSSWSSSVVRNLFRLGLIEPTYVQFLAYDPPGADRHGTYPESWESMQVPGDLSCIVLTDFGEDFCRAIGLAG